MTLPTAPDEYNDVKHGHYINEMGYMWILSGGLIPIAIPYNATDELLA